MSKIKTSPFDLVGEIQLQDPQSWKPDGFTFYMWMANYDPRTGNYSYTSNRRVIMARLRYLERREQYRREHIPGWPIPKNL